MSENLEILHPSTGECRIWDCPCHEFALKRPQEASEDSVMEFHLPSLKTSPTDRQAAKTPLPETASTFEYDWNHAPSAYKRVTEREIAEYFYLCGVQAGRVEMLATSNDDLRELLRVARERIVH